MPLLSARGRRNVRNNDYQLVVLKWHSHELFYFFDYVMLTTRWTLEYHIEWIWVLMSIPKCILNWNVDLKCRAMPTQRGLLLFLPLSGFVTTTLGNNTGKLLCESSLIQSLCFPRFAEELKLPRATAGRASSQNVMTSRSGHAARGRLNKFSTRTSHVSSVHIQQRPGQTQENREKERTHLQRDRE